MTYFYSGVFDFNLTVFEKQILMETHRKVLTMKWSYTFTQKSHR